MPSSSDRVASAAAHAFVADLDEPQLSDDDRHHLLTVMRLRPGQVVTVSDGAGAWRKCVVVDGGLTADGEIHTIAAAEPEVTVAFALTKGAKPEWAVQKLTEIGVDVIQPFVADRSIVRWDETKADSQVARWREVARLASMQSRRVTLPRIGDVRSFDEVAAEGGFCLADAGGGPMTLDRPRILVGPEGGWSPSETKRGLPTVDLGANVLRAETAAIVAGIHLCALRAR